MRQRREAMPGTGAETAKRRLTGRMRLMIAVLGMFVIFGAQAVAASANGGGSSAKVTKVTPNSGCPGEKVTVEGSGFKSYVDGEWDDQSFPYEQETPGKF